MEFLTFSPAGLGAIMVSVAIGSWSLGRWQSGIAASEDVIPAPASAGGEAGEAPMPRAALRATGAMSCQDAARAERQTALAAADSLGELHADISAYRRAEKVLASPDGEELRRRSLLADARSECRFLGLMGEPTCGVAQPARGACTSGVRCDRAEPLLPGRAWPERPRQPSPAALGLTRV